MSSAPRQSNGSWESPIAARMRLMTPSTPGIDVPGTRQLQKESEKPENKQEIGDIWVGQRGNR